MSPRSPRSGHFGDVFNTEKERLPRACSIASCLIYALAQLNYLQSLALEKVNVNVCLSFACKVPHPPAASP